MIRSFLMVTTWASPIMVGVGDGTAWKGGKPTCPHSWTAHTVKAACCSSPVHALLQAESTGSPALLHCVLPVSPSQSAVQSTHTHSGTEYAYSADSTVLSCRQANKCSFTSGKVNTRFSSRVFQSTHPPRPALGYSRSCIHSPFIMGERQRPHPMSAANNCSQQGPPRKDRPMCRHCTS